MKNSATLFLICAVLLFGGLACKDNPLAKFNKQYNCTLPGEPEPQTADDFVKRGAKHLELNNYSATFDECAFGAVSEALRLEPENPDALALRGNLYFARFKQEVSGANTSSKEKDWNAAVDDLNSAIRIRPANFVYYNIRAALYEAKAMNDEAIENLKSSLKLVESSVNYAKRGQLYFQKRDYENAVKDYSAAIKLAPEDADLYSKREEAYKKLGKNDLADANQVKAMELKDKDLMIDSENIETPSNKKPVPKTVSGGVLNGKATNLVKPVYPAAARAVRASGAVNVEVTVDEQGNVISASAVSGHPLLRLAAVAAARQSKFNPTKLSGQAVKVTGIIVYNFVPE